MNGRFSADCNGCGNEVVLREPREALTEEFVTESEYTSLAVMRGVCDACGETSEVHGPLSVVGATGSQFILRLPVRRRPADVVSAVVLDLLAASSADPGQGVRLYPTYEHYRLDHFQPELFHDVPFEAPLSVDVVEESGIAQDIANDMVQVGQAGVALAHCRRLVERLPILTSDSQLVENMHMLGALAFLSGAGDELDADKTAVNQGSSSRQRIMWRDPYAFGPDAPTIHGVPAGYCPASSYVERARPSPDERLEARLLLLLFSSHLLRFMGDDATRWQRFQHGMLLSKLRQQWPEASPSAKKALCEFYRDISGGDLEQIVAQ